MTLPTIILGLICSLLIGALFHLWRDGGAGRLLVYLILSTAGFLAGQWLGGWRNWVLLPIGALDLGMGALGSLVLLIGGDWLSHVELRHTRGDDGV